MHDEAGLETCLPNLPQGSLIIFRPTRIDDPGGSIQLRELLSLGNRKHVMSALAEGMGHGLADAAIVYKQQPASTFDVTLRGRWSCPSPRGSIEPLRRIRIFLEPVRRELA